jgi:beta-lactamase regulating signal transducer with metallopeptidase domain
MWDTLANWWAEWAVAMSWQVALLAGIVWVATRLSPKSSAAFRHLLWLLVFVRLLLPPGLATPWSAGTIGRHLLSPLNSTLRSESGLRIGDLGIQRMSENSAGTSSGPLAVEPVAARAASGPEWFAHPEGIVMAVWAVVTVALLGTLVFRYARYLRTVRKDLAPLPEELMAKIRVQGDAIGVRRGFGIHLTPHISTPAVLGFRRPQILLPARVVEDLTEPQLLNLVRHEMAHIKRNDIQIGWLVSVLLCFYWFHPAAWLASFYLRREREMACDDAVLYETRQEGKEYVATMVRMAESFDTRAPVGVGFVGLLEISDNLLHRVRSVLDGTRARRPGWRSVVILTLFALVFLPMGAWAPRSYAQQAAGDAVQSAAAERPAIVSTEPKNGATNVAPKLDAIKVTFDQDMAGGFSWTGGPPLFPETTGKPQWTDKRTCILPVRLEAAKLYRVGINSKSHQNFRSAVGGPVEPTVIAFTTEGADPSLVSGLEPPKVMSMTPANGAAGVASTLDRLTAVFDRPMGKGFSWVGGGDNYPETTGAPQWSEDGKTCSLPVKLKPDWTYSLSLNSDRHINFQSDKGVPLAPVRWEFTTGK